MKKERPSTKICKHCKTEMPYDAKVCPNCRKKQGLGIIPKALIVIISIGVIGSIFGGSETSDTKSKKEPSDKVETVSESIEEKQENMVETKTIEESEVKDGTEEENKNIPTEYKTALKSAETYSNMMHMSKAGIYDQLTSEYGDKFSPEAAQYAIDNMEADWNENALKSAENYSKTMHMSKAGLYDQLTSEYGEKFTEDEAKYAVDNVEADWKENALATAKTYQETMNMSPAAIHDQLTSEYGEKFTKEEADYAIENLE